MELFYFSCILQCLNFSKIGIWRCSCGLRWFMIWSYKMIVIYFNRVNTRRKQESCLRLLVEFVFPQFVIFFILPYLYKFQVLWHKILSYFYLSLKIVPEKFINGYSFYWQICTLPRSMRLKKTWLATIKQYKIHLNIDEDK